MPERALFLASVATATVVGFMVLGARWGWTPVVRGSVLTTLGVIVFCAVFGATIVRGSSVPAVAGALVGSTTGLTLALLLDKLRAR